MRQGLEGKGKAHVRLTAVAALMFLFLLSGLAAAEEEAPESTAASAQTLAASPVPQGEELLSKRTATSSTYALPHGERETRIYQEPVRYRDAEGDWHPIEEGLQAGPGASIVNGDNRFDVRLPEQLGETPVRFERGGDWVAFQLRGAESNSGELTDEETASYEVGQGGTSFEFSSLPNGLKENIMIAGPAQPSTFSFELSASEGVRPVLAEDGSIEFRKGEDDVVAKMPAPTIADEGEMPIGDPDIVSYDLRNEEGKWVLDVKAEPDWLAQPERRWPVTLDPTVVETSATQACGLWNYPGYETWTQCSSEGHTMMYSWALGSNQIRSLLFFNMSSVPSTAYVTSATVGIAAYAAATNTTGLQLKPMTQAAGAGVSWKCATVVSGSCVPWEYPGPGGAFNEAEGSEVLTSERGSAAGWWTFTKGLGPIVQRWVSGPAGSNKGLLVKQSDESPLCPGGTCKEKRVEWVSPAWPTVSERPYMKVTYLPKLSTAKVVSPSEGIRTAKRLKLKTTWSAAGAETITYQWKPTYPGTPGVNTWQDIPPSLVKDPSGKAVSSWPKTLTEAEKTSKATAPLFFDAAAASARAARDGESIYVRAVFGGTSGLGGSEGVTDGVNAMVDPMLGNVRDAKTQVGPGTLDLVTGNFTVTATDVSIPTPNGALEFSRSFSSREYERPPLVGVMGTGWRPAVPVEEAGGGAWRSARDETVEEEGSYTIVTDIEGGEIPFEWTGSAYAPIAELPGWTLTRSSWSSTQVTLSDPSGGRTVFSKNPSGSEYLPTEVTTPGGSGNTTQMAYEVLGGGFGKRLKTLIAPSAPGVTSCSSAPTTVAGCRALSLVYEKVSMEEGSFDRLTKIIYNGPAAGEGDNAVVAQYGYDTKGRLTEAWDPRISPALKTTYTYASGEAGPKGVIEAPLRKITPPGQKPWEMTYAPGWEGNEPGPEPEYYVRPKDAYRLTSVSRASLLSSPATATTTIAYEVPVSGSGAPYDLSSETIAKWAQEDIPTDATAIFPPDEVPSSSPPSSYTRATVHYMDAEGNLVNTATPKGAGTEAASISTSETNENGNVYRELTPQNRLRALASGSTTPETAAKAKNSTPTASSTPMAPR